MESALHGHDVFSAQPSEDELAAMSFYGGNGEVGYVAVWQFVSVSYF
jgi:hypothetical protein